MKKIITTVILFFILVPLTAEEVGLTQIDTNDLLFKGEIDIYFTFSNAGETELKAEDFIIREKTLGDLEIKGLEQKPNEKTGINFLLLIDNSGSMYEESYQGSRRIKQAKIALGSFLDQIEKSGDSVAVYAFNRELTELAPFGTKIPDVRRSLSLLEQPEPEMAYTELYGSLAGVIKDFPRIPGRRAVIVLSDGENFSVYDHGAVVPSEHGLQNAIPDDVVKAFNTAGITLDGINISDEKDKALEKICTESGGQFHDVRSTGDISRVYSEIREKIINEYKITVSAPPFPGNTGEIELISGGSSDEKTLLVPTLFGGASGLPAFFAVLLLLCGLAGLAGLFYIPFEKPVENARIQALDSNQKTILNEGATIIGASRGADFTLAGSPGIDAEHATILHDKRTGAFTLVSEKPVRVNNRKVKKRVLTPGDVIRIEGRTIIFDQPEKSGK